MPFDKLALSPGNYYTNQTMNESEDRGTWGELRPEKEESTDSGDLSKNEEEEKEAVGKRRSWSC